MLKNHADFRSDFFNVLDIVGQLCAVNNDLATLMLFKSIDATDQSRFTRT